MSPLTHSFLPCLSPLAFSLFPQRQWDNQKQQEVTLTKSNRFDVAMYTVTLAEGKKIMYTGEYGPHIQMGRCFTKDGKEVQGEHEWENHRKLGEAHDLSDEELAR